MNDPIGDMMTRIRNAQMRKPSRRCRRRARGCAAACSTCSRAKAISAAMPTVDHTDGRSELEIELKYFDGEPVIREIARVSKPGRRVYVSVRLCRASTTASAFDPFDAQGRHGRSRCTRRQCRRRSALHGVLAEVARKLRCLVSARRRLRSPPASPPTSRDRPSRSRVRRAPCSSCCMTTSRPRWTRADQDRPARRDQARALAVGHLAHPGRQSGGGVTKGFEDRLEINGVGYRAAVQGRAEPASRLQP